jgi:hypothetical protein
MSKEILLDTTPDGGQLVVRVSDSEVTADRVIPVAITHFTPMKRVPVLVTDPSGEIPQMILDYLMFENLTEEDRVWHEYYKARREDAVRYAKEIAENDRTFKEEALKALNGGCDERP